MTSVLGRALIWACVIAIVWYVGHTYRELSISQEQSNSLHDVARHYQMLKSRGQDMVRNKDGSQ